MRARTIGRWVGRAAVFVAFGVGIWAVAGLANVSGVGASVVSSHAAVEDGSDLSGQSGATTMDFEWN